MFKPADMAPMDAHDRSPWGHTCRLVGRRQRANLTWSRAKLFKKTPFRISGPDSVNWDTLSLVAARSLAQMDVSLVSDRLLPEAFDIWSVTVRMEVEECCKNNAFKT